jgi:hypothetical protein
MAHRHRSITVYIPHRRILILGICELSEAAHCAITLKKSDYPNASFTQIYNKNLSTLDVQLHNPRFYNADDAGPIYSSVK